MALKHYGGSTPTPASEWACPSCGHENTVPLKAGCQKCGAGADAKRVGAAPPVFDPPLLPPRLASATDAEHAYNTWLLNSHPGTHAEYVPLAKEAFMAGVAWAQAQTYERAVAPARAALDTLTEKGFPVADPVTAPLTLWTDDGKHQDPVDAPTLATLLAALAFYRDNVLNYNAVEGQLAPQQVTDLVNRLLPKETE